jgi:hypothetical protein
MTDKHQLTRQWNYTVPSELTKISTFIDFHLSSMRKVLGLALLVVLTLLAGCSMLEENLSNTPDNIEQSPTPSSTATPPTEITTSSPTPIAGTTTPPEEITQDSTPPQFSSSIPSDKIVLTVPELPSGYAFDGETYHQRTETSGERQASMEEQNLLLIHSRAFVTENKSLPTYVFSSVSVYEDTGASTNWLASHLDGLRQEYGASVERQNISSTVQVTVTRFENNQGLQTTAFYRQSGNLVYYTAVTGESYNETLTAELFVMMLSAAES